MLTEDQVVEAYRLALRLRVRDIQIENTGATETDAQQDERLEAICQHSTLEIQYLADQVT